VPLRRLSRNYQGGTHGCPKAQERGLRFTAEMKKIKVKSPIVEIDGDEMARIMWQQVRDKLILPFLDIDLKYYDLSLKNRDASDDRITLDAAAAAKEYGVSVKCSTITPDDQRVKQEGLKRRYPSPNGVIRNELDGTIFREPIICSNVPRLIPHWKYPVVVARHAYGEQYKAQEIAVPGPGRAKLVFEPADGGPPIEHQIHHFKGPGVALGMFNVDDSIRGFARACLNFGLQRKYPVYFSHKATVLKQYDGRFIQIFKEVYEAEFAASYSQAGIVFEARLIDDMVASNLKWEGGYLWACKNYDGDVHSDSVAQGYGSAGLMTSLLMSPDGSLIESETAHGTVARHFSKWQQDGEAVTNPIATVFAWTRGVAHRGRLDGTPDVQNFAGMLEKACVDVVESGRMTKDLAQLVGSDFPYLTTDTFIDAIAGELRRRTG
jgi:isocitrate dehydrogenase